MADRRYRKTEAAIEAAFLKLVSEKPIRQITVKELYEVADMNKSTFYAHYQDIYAYAEVWLLGTVATFDQILADYNFEQLIFHLPFVIRRITEKIHQFSEQYRMTAKSPEVSTLLVQIKKKLVERMLQRATAGERADMSFRCSVTFVIFGIIGLYETYYYSELTEETIANVSHRIQAAYALQPFGKLS